MWSLGMVLYYLCYSRLPYTQIDDVDILKEEIREFKSYVFVLLTDLHVPLISVCQICSNTSIILFNILFSLE